MQGLIHYNPNLSHQVDHAQAFLNCGFAATPKPTGDADIHVISGPWFAYHQWKHHDRVLMIDRAWWNDPDCVSIGWLQSDGSRRFAQGSAPRPVPEMREWKQPSPRFGELKCLVLADYGQNFADIAMQAAQRYNTVTIRQHPADRKSLIDLHDDIAWHDVVIGNKGSAVFDAIALGVPTICHIDNECAPVCTHTLDAPLFRGDRSQWLHEMSYKQFSLAEIADGTAWQLLKDVQ